MVWSTRGSCLHHSQHCPRGNMSGGRRVESRSAAHPPSELSSTLRSSGTWPQTSSGLPWDFSIQLLTIIWFQLWLTEVAWIHRIRSWSCGRSERSLRRLLSSEVRSSYLILNLLSFWSLSISMFVASFRRGVFLSADDENWYCSWLMYLVFSLYFRENRRERDHINTCLFSLVYVSKPNLKSHRMLLICIFSLVCFIVGIDAVLSVSH